MHEGQHVVTLATVRTLVDEQFPQWRGLPVGAVPSSGTVHAIFRLGERFTVRLPLTGDEAAATRAHLEAEAEAGRRLLGRTRFRTPEPVAIGEPGAGYPLPWSVQTWLDGDVATPDALADSHTFARDLAAFIADVRRIDTGGRTFAGLGRRGRGGELTDHDDWMATCLERSERLVDVPPLRRLWAELRELPRGDAPDLTTHGDLMPGNLLVGNLLVRNLALGGQRAGPASLTGVLDCGGVGPADPALDLVCAWHLFEADARTTLRHELGCGDLEWERGRAWAFEQAMGALWYYAGTNPAMALMGRRTVERLLAR